MGIDVNDMRIVLRGMREKYYEFDLDGDGDISCEEFRQVLEEMVGEPCPEDDWNEFIPKIDSDNSGTVSFAEFLHALYHWFAEVDPEADDDDEEKDETDEVFFELKRLYTTAKEHSGSKFLSAQAMAQVFASLDATKATNEIVERTMGKVRQEMEGRNDQFTFKDFLFGVSAFLLDDEEEDSDDNGGAGEGKRNVLR